MTRDEIIAAWSHQADYMNQWETLGEDEKLEWAMKLEREACAKVCESIGDYDENVDEYYSDIYASAIRNRGQA
jgi:hypothetical protein